MTGSTSVVIPVYNGERYVAETVASALAQTVRPREVLVVDDGSTDGTAAALEAFGDAIRLVRQGNAGVAAARNHGARLATGRYLAFLDADDVWLPTKLERQEAVLAADPQAGLVHCGVVEIDARGRPGRTLAPGLEGWIADDVYRMDRSAVLGGGSGAVFRRDLFRELGGYDERLSTSADWDLFLRVALVAPVRYVHEALLQYRIHGSNMSANVALMERDMRLAMRKAEDHPELRPHRRRARANLGYALGGGYLNSGQPVPGILRLARAVALRPALLAPTGRAILRRLSRSSSGTPR